MALAALVMAGFELDCGARPSLPLPEPCDQAGHTRACHDTCGKGTETCENGYWQTCVVPPASRPCSNTCGDGEQTCTDDAWQTCVVPVSSRSCSNDCGEGQQTCVDNAWLACSVPVAQRSCQSLCGPGTEACTDGAWQPCDAPLPTPPTLHTVVRNFRPNQTDFVPMCCRGGSDPNIVAFDLGPDDKPVYAGGQGTLTTHGKASFGVWFNDVAGTNLSAPLDLPFTTAPDGSYVFDNEAFFPIDGQLFDNTISGHNFPLTLEAHATIQYGGGEIYGFSSDDDLWVFVNRRLAVDLGGLHQAMSASLDLDQSADVLGIAKGQMVSFDMFYANRQPPGAVLMVDIPSADLWSCP